MLSGNIRQYDKAFILLFSGNQIDTLKLGREGQFFYKTDNKDERQIRIMIDNFFLPVYIAPDRPVYLEVNADSLQNGDDLSAVNFSGQGSAENILLLRQEAENPRRKYVDHEDYRQHYLMPLYGKQPEAFEKEYNKRFIEEINDLERISKENPRISEKLITALRILAEIERARMMSYYPLIHAELIPGDTLLTIPPSFGAYSENIPRDNIDLYKYNGEYSGWINAYYNRKFTGIVEENSLINGTPEYWKAYFHFLRNEIGIAEMREAMFLRKMLNYTDYSMEIRSILRKRMGEFINDAEELKRMTEIVKRAELLQKGSPAPVFAFPDINGQIVSTTDYAGNILFVDVWATWCGPCLREIPYFHQLQEDFKDHKDLVFMSVSIMDKEDTWRDMLAEKKMKGIQLYGGEGENAFTKEYVIHTIPRFIIIDREGKIVTANAPLPSDPLCRKLLDSLTGNSPESSIRSPGDSIRSPLPTTKISGQVTGPAAVFVNELTFFYDGHLQKITLDNEKKFVGQLPIKKGQFIEISFGSPGASTESIYAIPGEVIDLTIQRSTVNESSINLDEGTTELLNRPIKAFYSFLHEEGIQTNGPIWANQLFGKPEIADQAISAAKAVYLEDQTTLARIADDYWDQLNTFFTVFINYLAIDTNSASAIEQRLREISNSTMDVTDLTIPYFKNYLIDLSFTYAAHKTERYDLKIDFLESAHIPKSIAAEVLVRYIPDPEIKNHLFFNKIQDELLRNGIKNEAYLSFCEYRSPGRSRFI